MVEDEQQQQDARDPGPRGAPAEPVERARPELRHHLLLGRAVERALERSVDEVEEVEEPDPHDARRRRGSSGTAPAEPAMIPSPASSRKVRSGTSARLSTQMAARQSTVFGPARHCGHRSGAVGRGGEDGGSRRTTWPGRGGQRGAAGRHGRTERARVGRPAAPAGRPGSRGVLRGRAGGHHRGAVLADQPEQRRARGSRRGAGSSCRRQSAPWCWPG